MAIVTTVTIATIVYNVYGITSDPVGDADDWFGGRLGVAVWTAATVDEKGQALITAARMMDRRAIWSGSKTVASQDLEWPRDGAFCDGEAVANGTIPDDIAYGEFELALALLEDESIQDAQGTGSNVKSAKAGSAKVEFFQPTLSGANNQLFPVTVTEYIGCFFDDDLDSGGTFTGTDRCSDFDDDDQYNLHRGYA